MSKTHEENFDNLLKNPFNYTKGIRKYLQGIINIELSQLWVIFIQLGCLIRPKNYRLMSCMLGLRLVKDLLFLTSHKMYIMICIHIVPQIRTICEIGLNKDLNVRVNKFQSYGSEVGKQKINQEQVDLIKSILLLADEIMSWFHENIQYHPFRSNHRFRSAFAIHSEKLNKKKSQKHSYTFFKKEEIETLQKGIKQKEQSLEEEIKPMKEFVQQLVEKVIIDECYLSMFKLNLLIRTGDTHIIEAATSELIDRINNKPSTDPPFNLLQICKELSMGGQVEFNTIMKAQIMPEIFKYLFTENQLIDSREEKPFLGKEKKELLELVSAWNQIALKYRIDNDVYHEALLKAKYWLGRQINFSEDSKREEILKEINHDKNESVERKYAEKIKKILRKLKSSQYKSSTENDSRIDSIGANLSQYPSELGTFMQNQQPLKSSMKEKEKPTIKAQNSIHPPSKFSNSSLSRQDRFHHHQQPSYEDYSDNKVLNSVEDDVKDRLSRKMKMKKSVRGSGGHYSFKQISHLDLDKNKPQQIHKPKHQEKIIMKKEKKAENKYLIGLQKTKKEQMIDVEVVKITVQPTVKKPPFGFKMDNNLTMESQNYSSSLSQSKSSQNLDSRKGQDSYSNFSDILNPNPKGQIREIENDLLQGYAINPYKNREKQLNKKINQLKQNNITYDNKIKEKDEKITKIKQKIQHQKQKYATYQVNLGKAYENINENIDSLLLSSKNYDRPPDPKLQEQLKPLKRVYHDLFEPVPKKILKQILYKKCLLLKNANMEIGYVNNHEKQNIMLYYTFNRSFDEAHIFIENHEEIGFILEEDFDIRIRNIPKGKHLKVQIKVFDFDELINRNCKHKLMNLVTELTNQPNQFEDGPTKQEHKVELPYTLYGNFIKFTKIMSKTNPYIPSYASFWEVCCDELYKNKKEYLQMLFGGGFWQDENTYRIECTFKGIKYRMAVITDHRNFCIQGEGKGNPHVGNVIGSLLIK